MNPRQGAFPDSNTRGVDTVLMAVAIAILFVLALYDPAENPDYRDYAADYSRDTTRFEVGYRLFVGVARLLGLSFDQFRTIWIAFSIVILICAYRNWLTLLTAAPSAIYLSQSLFGTQIRYALAVSIAVFLISYPRGLGNFYVRLIVALALSLIHNGAILLSLLILLYPLSVRLARYNWKIFVGICAAGSLVSLIALTVGAEFLLHALNRAYYLTSEYNRPKSLASIAHGCLGGLLFILVMWRSNVRDEPALIIGTQVIFVVIAFSSMAYVGGRYQYVFWLLEPLAASLAMRIGYRKQDYLLIWLGVAIVILALTKLWGREIQLGHLPISF